MGSAWLLGCCVSWLWTSAQPRPSTRREPRHHTWSSCTPATRALERGAQFNTQDYCPCQTCLLHNRSNFIVHKTKRENEKEKKKKCDKNRKSFEINQSKSSVDVMVQMQTYLCVSKCTRASVD